MKEKSNLIVFMGFKHAFNKNVTLVLLFLYTGIMYSQNKSKVKFQKESDNLTYTANQLFEVEQEAIKAETTYRKAISKNKTNGIAQFNFGNLHYQNDRMGEAFIQFKEAGKVVQEKTNKHKAYHNIGNVFMQSKEYGKAVEAYKEALRNNSTDEETRYNLALAKELLKKQEQENKNNKNDQEDNKDQENNKDQQKNKEDNKDQNNKDQQKNNEKGEEDKNNEGNSGEDKKDENKPEKKQQNQEQAKPKDNKEQPQQNQLSPQQIKNILDAMNNEEKKIQKKMNAKKIKGTPTKSEKDW